jgi:PLP dependent protein
MFTIQDRYQNINERIEKSCVKAGRSREGVKLVVVSKGQPVEKIVEVINAGARILGENYLDETVVKIAEIGVRQNLQWHMIGHLQSRKVKYLYPDISMIHSIDRMDVANKIEAFCIEKVFKLNGLIELNIAGEESKTGFDVSTDDKITANMENFIKICSLKLLNIVGLMVMPPYSLNPDQNRRYFEKCRKIMELVNNNLTQKKIFELSMGTSADFETAIEEGSTYVRVGEAIMGPRVQKMLEEK